MLSYCVSHLPLLQGKLHPICTEIKRDPLDFIWNCIRAQVHVMERCNPLTTVQPSDGPKAVSLLHQNKRQSYHLNSCQKGKASKKDRGFATLTHQESVFNVTTVIPEEGQYAPTNPQQLPCTEGFWTARCAEESGSLTQSRAHPGSAPSTAPILTEKKALWAPRLWVKASVT